VILLALQYRETNVSKNKHGGSFEGKRGLTVEVRNGNVEGAIRLLTRKVKQEGLMRELRARSYYEKPSDRRRRERAEAKARWRKVLAKSADNPNN
jgi:small subunit ribosomal protein S21